jgi:hypothetical protein
MHAFGNLQVARELATLGVEVAGGHDAPLQLYSPELQDVEQSIMQVGGGPEWQPWAAAPLSFDASGCL